MPKGLEPGPANLQTMSFNGVPGWVRSEPLEILPQGVPAQRWVSLLQRESDARSAMIAFDKQQEVSLEATTIANRIAELTRTKAQGGFGLDEEAHQVVVERAKLARVTAERDRLRALSETRAAKWKVVGRLRRSVQAWLTEGGIPHGCRLTPWEGPAVSRLMGKTESPLDAIARHRSALDKCKARLRDIEAAPWPLAVVLQNAKRAIDALAQEGVPNLAAMVAHGSPLAFPKARMEAAVFNVLPQPDSGPIAFGQVDATLPTFAWVFRDELLARVKQGLGAVADDERALGAEQREKLAAEIAVESLKAERAEVALIAWLEREKGEIVEFRQNTSPVALLSVALETQAQSLPGSTGEHSYEVVGV